MDETVKALVLQLQEIVRKQTTSKYPDVNNAVTSLQDYVKERTASKSGVEDKLKELEDILSKKAEKKKSSTDLIEKIREAMRLQKRASTGATKSKEDKRKPSSPATSDRATPMPSKTKENTKLRSELTQPEETTELSGKIDQNEEEDISRLKTENQYLRKTLDGLHKYIIGGDETALTELKPPKNMKDNQSIVEVEANVKEVTKKFHEIKTNAENVIKERECLSSTLQCLINHVQGLSTEGDISFALDQMKSSVKKESQANQFLTQAKEIIGIQMEWKREAEYATHLFKELNERLAYDGKQDTQIGLKEPPVQMERASSKNGKKGHKNQNDKKPSSRHIEQMQSNFAIVSNVLKKLMNAEESIVEWECLLSTLECLRNYVRDLFEGKTEAETSPSWDEIWSSIKKESSVSQGLTHAKEIASYQMEWKREAEYASNLLEQLNGFATNDGKEDKQVILQEPVIPVAHDSRTDAKKDSKKRTDQPPRSRHVQQSLKNFSSASKVLKKQMDAANAVKERECLLLALDCLFKYSQDLSEGTTEGDISSTLDQIKSPINKESPANQGLSHAGAIFNIHMEWKREVEYVACLLEELANVSQSTNNGDNSTILSHPENFGSSRDYKTKDGKKTESSRNKPMKSVQNEKLMRYYGNASDILKQMKEKELEVEYVACLLEELANVSQSTNNGDNSIILSHPENFGSSRDYKTKDGKKTESSRNKPIKSVQNEKLMRHYGNASYILKQIKEKGVLRIDLGKRTAEVEDLMARLTKLQGENIEIKNDADSLRTRLSEHAGALLTHNNPSISDLSDPNRPTKLSEMYSELYDNQWTDAFANIAKKDTDISDNTIVGYLYEMLVDGYHFCEDVRRKQILALEDILFDPAGDTKTSQIFGAKRITTRIVTRQTGESRQKEEISTIFAKHLSDVAKLSGNKSSAHVAKAFVMDEKTKDKYRKMIKLCERYIQECVQLCWLMQVQTPPLCLDLKTIQGQTFDKNCYKEYTKKGKKIAFVVWPALFLHENGPLLSKGIAQCE